MPLAVTSKEVIEALKPLGFNISGAENKVRPTHVLTLTHPSHTGTIIEITVENDAKVISEMMRKVHGGPESKLTEGYTSDQLRNLTDAQVGHMYAIDFGEYLDYEELESISELVALVQKNIVVRRFL